MWLLYELSTLGFGMLYWFGIFGSLVLVLGVIDDRFVYYFLMLDLRLNGVRGDVIRLFVFVCIGNFSCSAGGLMASALIVGLLIMFDSLLSCDSDL